MKGKTTFTQTEVDKIKELIIEKLRTTPNKQKVIRDKIRKIGFYYTDFSQAKVKGGYTVEDFELLISSGMIKIV
jgi:GH18 family chitinase